MIEYNDYPELQNVKKFYSIDTEQKIIGIILLEPEKLLEMDKLLPCAMYDLSHKMILEACYELSNDGKQIDAVVIAEYFDERNRLAEVGGLDYLLDIVRNTAGSHSLNSYVKIVNDRAKERAILKASNDIRDVMTMPDLTTDERIGETEKIISLALESDEGVNSVSTTKEAVKSYIEKLDHRFQNGVENGLMTGIDSLDDRFSGFMPGDFIIVGGRPSMGKTTVATNLLRGPAESGKRCYCSSLEMETSSLMNRFIASVAGIGLKTLKDATLEDGDWPKLTAAVSKIKDWSIVFDDQGGVDIADLCNRWRAESRKNGLDFIVVDYLQLITDRSEKNRFDVVSSVSRKLKQIAKELKVPVVALSQLSRKVEERTDKRPTNADLRESGQIEQDADIIMFVYRDEIYNQDTHQKGVMELITTKFREGEIGTDYVQFIGQYNQIKKLEGGYTPPPKEEYKPKKRGF